VYKGDLDGAGVALQRALECSESRHEIALYNAAILKYRYSDMYKHRAPRDFEGYILILFFSLSVAT
jgi:hypothetical protein